MLHHMGQMRTSNTKLIRSLDLVISPGADKYSWLNLLHSLPTSTTGLKRLTVCWWGEGRRLQTPPWEELETWSLGKDIAFAQAIAGLSNLRLEKVRIEGYYAKPWPAYFRDKLGAGVVEAVGGRRRAFRDDVDRFHEEDFKIFQRGTELLNPWEEQAGVGAEDSHRSGHGELDGLGMVGFLDWRD